MYQIKTTLRRVEKEFAALPRQVRERVIRAVRELSQDPRLSHTIPPAISRSGRLDHVLFSPFYEFVV